VFTYRIIIGGGGIVLFTVIDTGAEVVLAFEVSLAMALSVCVPFGNVVVFKLTA
jgi:hypothetical protein